MSRPPMAPTLLLSILLACLAAASFAQSPATGGARPPAPSAQSAEIAKPAWKDLSPSQRDALAPLAREWDAFDRARKLKWLDVANKYPQLSPEAQKRLHERMVEFVKLTPEQRKTARTNFQRAYELPLEQRQSLVQQYQELPADRKQALADKASRKAETPKRRPATPEPKPSTKPGDAKKQ